MSIDLNGTAAIITATLLGLAAFVGPAVNAWLQIKAAKAAEANKMEAIQARADALEAQLKATQEVHTLVNNRSEAQDAKIESLTQRLAVSDSALTQANTDKGGA